MNLALHPFINIDGTAFAVLQERVLVGISLGTDSSLLGGAYFRYRRSLL
jgi:hypothetical protein